MKLMTYNILNGGEFGLDKISEIIKKENPDYLTINEANNFDKSDKKILKEFAQKINFPYFELSLSGEYDYHVAVFSKYSFKTVEKPQPLMRACIVGLINTPIGELSIASLHLTPYSEAQRIPEIDLILNEQKKYKNKILMGDMNSLSKHDNYDQSMIKSFNYMQKKKFTRNKELKFDVVDKILNSGYIDSALELGKNKEYTAPTSINEFAAHSNMRLDYIFISENLKLNLRNYIVIKNELTENASDHYPIMVELS